jgi:hypothetical protein
MERYPLKRLAFCLLLIAIFGLVPMRRAAAEGPVHMESGNDPNITLERVTAEVSDPWGSGTGRLAIHATECAAPCDKPLDPNAKYFVSGPGVRDSAPFLVPRGTQVLTVKPGSQFGWSLRLFGMSLGASSAVGGAVFLLVPQIGLDDAGKAMLGVGSAVAVVGLIAMLLNRTTVDFETGRSTGTDKTSPLARALLTRQVAF